MRVICRVIGTRYDAAVMVQLLLPVLLLMPVREAVTNVHAGRSNCYG